MSTFTLVHVVVSLIGILSAIAVLLGLLRMKRLDGWNAVLITIVLTIVAAIKFRPGFICCEERPVPVKQGNLELLQNPVAQELLHSKIPARLAYIWMDGTPRVVPIWFHWNGHALVMATPPKAPKLKALAKNPKVSLTIDDNTFPHKVLLIRGIASLQQVDGIVPEYAAAAERYFGREQGLAWIQQVRRMTPATVKVTITPEWVGVLDFQTRSPSAISA
jgi:pyridoxamine 5'-phosphate oxidase-like protein